MRGRVFILKLCGNSVHGLGYHSECSRNNQLAFASRTIDGTSKACALCKLLVPAAVRTVGRAMHKWAQRAVKHVFFSINVEPRLLACRWGPVRLPAGRVFSVVSSARNPLLVLREHPCFGKLPLKSGQALSSPCSVAGDAAELRDTSAPGLQGAV